MPLTRKCPAQLRDLQKLLKSPYPSLVFNAQNYLDLIVDTLAKEGLAQEALEDLVGHQLQRLYFIELGVRLDPYLRELFDRKLDCFRHYRTLSLSAPLTCQWISDTGEGHYRHLIYTNHIYIIRLQ